jgi:hypothetical protein
MIIFSLIFMSKLYSQANDNCASATVITVDAALLCGQVASAATSQAGECLVNWGGGTSNSTLWYRFTATNDSTVLNLIATTQDSYFLTVFGPAPACQPACAANVYSAQEVGDPGEHHLITGLTTGQSYLIQIDAVNPSGGATSNLAFCIGVNSPVPAGLVGTSNLISQCGTSFSNSTNGGYWQSGTGLQFANFDGVAGNDFGFIGNNTSWSTFCALITGTWSVTVSGVSNCTLPAPNQGVQGSVFTGTPTGLVNQGNSPNPIAPGASWTTPVINVAAGACAYIAIDGFAGDACNYTVTLTNLSTPCIVVLPIELLSFDIERLGADNRIKWVTSSERESDFFTIEKSFDGIKFLPIENIDGQGTSNSYTMYSIKDYNVSSGINYYRLKHTDFDGKFTYSETKAVIVSDRDAALNFSLVPNPSDALSQTSLILNKKISDAITVTILDINSNVVHEYLTEVNGTTIELNHQLKSGVYIVRVICEGSVLTKRLVIR